MPANLGPEYLAAENDLRHAETPADKIAALERMWATLPKHKGTDKLQADIKRRLSAARKETQKKGAAHTTPLWVIPREGAGQVALIGPPNSGKSSLLAALTHAHPQIGDYPYTTRLPLPGMMRHEDAPIQLVDCPPIGEEFTEPWLGQLLRNASLSVLLVALDDPHSLEEIDFVLDQLAKWRVPDPSFMVGAKADLDPNGETRAILEELYGARFRFLAVSATSGCGLKEFGRLLFERLEVVRVYTKIPGKKAEMGAPYLLKRGETVLDAARHVHKDFAEQLKYARLFRPDSGGPDGLMVERNHLVKDRDILEFHI